MTAISCGYSNYRVAGKSLKTSYLTYTRTYVSGVNGNVLIDICSLRCRFPSNSPIYKNVTCGIGENGSSKLLSYICFSNSCYSCIGICHKARSGCLDLHTRHSSCLGFGYKLFCLERACSFITFKHLCLKVVDSLGLCNIHSHRSEYSCKEEHHSYGKCYESLVFTKFSHLF